MVTRSTTLATWAGAIAEALQDYGLDSAEIFSRAGLEIQQTRDANARYLVTEMARLWRTCVDATGDPAFGLKVPRHHSVTTFHGLGMALEASATLRESLERLIKLSRLVSNVAEIKLYEDARHNWVLNWHIEPATRREVADEAMDAFLGSMGMRLEPEDFVEVRFIRRQPEDPTPWQQLFGCPVIFGSDTDALIIRAEAMDKRRAPGNPELARAGETVAMDYLQRFERENILMQVENEIRHHLQEGEPKQQEIADKLCLSVRQMQRKLAAENTSFAQLLQEIRHQLAREYLADPQRSIVEISLNLGFSDQSNFASAFRRWEGVSPTQYRERHRSG